MEDFLKLLKAQDEQLAEFSDSLWLGLLGYTTIYADGRMTFTGNMFVLLTVEKTFRFPLAV